MQASNVNLICIFLYRTLWTCVKLPLWVIRLVEQPSLKVYVRKSNSSTYQTDSSLFMYCKRTFLNRPHYMTQTYHLWLHSCQMQQKLRPVSQTVQLVIYAITAIPKKVRLRLCTLTLRCGIALDAWMSPIDEEIFPRVKQPIFFINSEKFQWAGNIARIKKLDSAFFPRKMITIRSANYTELSVCA